MRISRNEEWEGGGREGGGISTTGHPYRKISADSGSNQNADELMKPSTSSISLRVGDKRRLKEFPSSSEIEQKLIFRHHRIPILIQI